MKCALTLAASLTVLLTTIGCDSAKVTGPATVADEDEMVAVPTPEEAQAEADRTIDETNADAVFAELEAEIEADLDSGG